MAGPAGGLGTGGHGTAAAGTGGRAARASLTTMLILRCEASVFGANCYVVAAGPGRPALVVDPGAGVADRLPALLDEHALTVGAVVATHGHPDHVWDAAAVAGLQPVHVAAPDLYRMTDPADVLGPTLAPAFTALAGTPWRRPADVAALPGRFLGEGGAEAVPGVVVRAVPAPGHTEGSTVLLVRGAPQEGSIPLPGAGERLVAFTGDVLFAGSVGRTDLPGGDQRHMLSSLRLLATAMDPATVLLPGHGAGTTLAAEREANPYLREAMRIG